MERQTRHHEPIYFGVAKTIELQRNYGKLFFTHFANNDGVHRNQEKRDTVSSFNFRRGVEVFQTCGCAVMCWLKTAQIAAALVVRKWVRFCSLALSYFSFHKGCFAS